MEASAQLSGRRFAGRAVAPSLPGVLLLLMATFTVGALPVLAQTGSGGQPAATIYVPLGHPVYETLDLLRGASLIPRAWLSQRPISRQAAAEALRVGRQAARQRGMSALAEAAGWRLREFAAEVAPREPDLTPRRGSLQVGWSDGEGASLTGELTLELGYENRGDIPPDFENAFIGRGGVEVYGTAGAGFGYAARYRQSSETRAGTEKNWPFSPTQNVTQVRMFGDYAAYTESSGHLSWDGRYLAADIRLDSPAWGPSPARNLLLSGRAPSFGHLQGRVAFGDWFRYAMVVGTLKSGIIDSLRSYQPGEPAAFRGLERSKYLVGHRLDVHLFSTLQLGLTEMAVVGDRFPELLYLVPTVSIWDAQHYIKDPDNTMIGLDVAWTPAGGPTLYGALGMDEWQMQSAFDDSSSHNWLAFQVGGMWTPPFDGGRWNVWLEATRVLPNVYRHKYPVNDWAHAGSWLGFWSAQNSDVIQGRLTYLISGNARAALWGRYARKGGEVSRLEQYRIPPSEKFLFGAVRTGGWVGGSFTLEGEQHWQLTAEVVKAPAGLWPHDRLSGTSALPASLGQEWQFFLKLTYNPF